MNYLAHLFFAGSTAESVIGNLAADAFKGRIDEASPLAAAIRRHRSIDAFTDSHPAVGRGRRRLEREFHHYARVITDVFWDHFLAVRWNACTDEPFDAFRRRVYPLVLEGAPLLPPEMRARFVRMAEEDWLSGYARLQGIRRALHYLSHRFKRPVALEYAVDTLELQYDEFQGDFEAFFPELIAAFGIVTGAESPSS